MTEVTEHTADKTVNGFQVFYCKNETFQFKEHSFTENKTVFLLSEILTHMYCWGGMHPMRRTPARRGKISYNWALSI